MRPKAVVLEPVIVEAVEGFAEANRAIGEVLKANAGGVSMDNLERWVKLRRVRDGFAISIAEYIAGELGHER